MSSGERKKERRLKRHLRNKYKDEAHKEEAWKNGKLIEENHNGGYYSPEYSLELCDRLYQRLYNAQQLARTMPENSQYLVKSGGSRNGVFIYYFRRYRMKVRDLILHWPPTTEKTEGYNWLKGLIETYWDMPEELINYNGN